MTQTAQRTGGTGGPGGGTSGALVIGWGTPSPGREQAASQVINQTVEYFKSLQQRGELTEVQPVALEPHGHDMSGFVLLYGSPDILSRIRTSDQFIDMMSKAQVATTFCQVIGGWSGPAFDRLVQSWSRFGSELR